MKDLNSLAVFAKVVESKSFSVAARLLGMPVSTVSRRIAELEDHLGVRLLGRSFDDFSPMDVIPSAVSLTTYDGGSEDFMLTRLEDLVEKIAAKEVPIQIGKVFKLDQIVEAHRCMEENKAGGKIVVLT